MKRFFGMMPSGEVKKEKHYKDNSGLSVTIQAGPHGWTILWADGGSNYKDEDDETNKNFEKAYNIANEKVGPLIEEKSASNACEVITMDVD